LAASGLKPTFCHLAAILPSRHRHFVKFSFAWVQNDTGSHVYFTRNRCHTPDANAWAAAALPLK
jgi:hypothetical protein